jgi:hypothetical protein
MDYLMPIKHEPFEPSSIESIDTAMFKYIDEELNLHANTNNGYNKAKVLWLGAERAFQIKNNKELRDSAGKLILPLIVVSRDSISKDPAFKGAFQANVFEHPDYKGGAITISRRIKQDKTRNFANTKRNRGSKNGDETGRVTSSNIVYQEIIMPAPVYVAVMYTITLRTEYQQQMNSLSQPFMTKTGNINSFMLKNDNYRYEAFIQPDFSESKNLDNLGEEERMFETKVQIRVQGYLVGEGDNREKPKVTIRENRTKVKISRERVIIGDKIPWKDKDSDYRD